MATVTSLRFAISASYMDRKAFKRVRHDIRRTAEDQSFLTESTRRVSRAFMTLGPVAVPALAATAKASANVGVAMGAAALGIGLYVKAASNTLKKNREVKDSYIALINKMDNFGHSARGTISKTMILGYETLGVALNKLEKAMPPIANAMHKIAVEVAGFVNSDSFDRFVTWLGVNAPMAITSFWRAGVNLGQGLFTLLKRMGAFETSGFLNWLVNVTNRFKEWAASPAAGEMLKFFKESGPIVGQFALALMRLATTISTALGPLGLVILRALTPILNFMADFLSKNPWVVQGVWLLYTAIKALAFAEIVGKMLVLFALRVGWIGTKAAWAAKQIYWLIYWIRVQGAVMVAWAKGSKIFTAAISAISWAFRRMGISAALAWIAALGPVAWIIAGIVAIGGALVYAYFKFDWFRKFVDKVWDLIVMGAKWVWQRLVNIWRNVGMVLSWVYNNVLTPIGHGIVAVFRWIGKVWNTVYNNVIAPVARVFGAVFRWVADKVRRAMHIIGEIMYWVWATIRVVSYLVWKGLTTIFGGAFRLVGKIVASVAKWIGRSARWVWQKVTQAFNAVVGFFGRVFGPVWRWLGRVVRNVTQWIIDRARTMGNWVIGLFNKVRAWFGRVFGPVWRWLGRLIRNVTQWIIDRARTMRDWVIGVFRRIQNWMSKTFGPAWRWLGRVISNAWDWIMDKARKARDFVNKIFRKIGDGVDWMRRAFWTGTKAIGRAWHWIAELAKKPIRWVINTVWNDGIRKVWNSVAKKIGVREVSKIKGFAEGGVLPGYMAQKRDNMMVPMRAGEGVIVPEVVRALGPGFVHSLNSLGNRGVGAVRSAFGGAKRNGGMPPVFSGPHPREGQSHVDRFLAKMQPQGFALGGIIDKFAGWAKGDFIKKAYGKALNLVFNPLKDGTKQWGTNPDRIKAYPGFGARFILDRVKAWLMSFLDRFSGGSAVVSAARSYLGKGDTTGDNSGNPFNAMWGYGDGTPWCANFVSAAVKKAGAGKFYPGYPTAAVNTYYRNMKKVPFKKARPGDLRTTGTSQHINIVESNMGDHKLRTIGGNQGPKVNRRTDTSGHVLRPKPGAPSTGGGAWFGKGTIPHGQRYGFLRQAMRLAGVKVTGAALKRWYRLIANESGWQPGRTNDWDVNARAGTPSKGLAQIIAPTFNAYKKKGWRWGNEMHMTAAAMRYARSRYGNLAGTPLGGYQDGGRMKPGELAVVGEKRPELFQAGRQGGTVYPNLAKLDGGGDTYNITVNGVMAKDKREFKRAVVEAIEEAKRGGSGARR